MLMHRVMTGLVARLLELGELQLVEGASPEAVVAELLAALSAQAAFAQVGPFVSGVLLRSRLVEELFADDRRLIELVGDLGL